MFPGGRNCAIIGDAQESEPINRRKEELKNARRKTKGRKEERRQEGRVRVQTVLNHDPKKNTNGRRQEEGRQ